MTFASQTVSDPLEILHRETVRRASIYGRNSISYIVARSWRSSAKADAISALKTLKAGSCVEMAALAADDLVSLIERLSGSTIAPVTTVPCGHSKRSDCFGRVLAEGVAQRLGVECLRLWSDRFISGSSHPKEFWKLTPLEWVAEPPARIILIDDVATSGQHLEEALTALRDRGVEASAYAWIGGTIEGEKAASRLSGWGSW